MASKVDCKGTFDYHIKHGVSAETPISELA